MTQEHKDNHGSESSMIHMCVPSLLKQKEPLISLELLRKLVTSDYI